MPTSSNREKIHAISITIMILCAVICYQILRLEIVTGAAYQLISLIRTGIYVFLIVSWGASVQRRVINTTLRRYLLSIVFLLLLWFVLRTIRYMFTEGITSWQIYCWYGYYIPLLLIPMMGIFTAACMGKQHVRIVPTFLKLLWIPNGILILSIITNNIHQLAFYYPFGLDSGNPIYVRGPLYYICFAWIITEVTAFLALLFHESHVPGKRKRIWVPILPATIALLYSVGYLTELPVLFLVAGDMTAVFTLIILAVFEICIKSGLIPSNSRYDEVFRASTIGAQIVNNNYDICFRADNATCFSKEIMRRTESGPVEMDHERLSGAPISGGHVLWIENIASLQNVLKQLEQLGSILAKDNDLLKAEVELKERHARIDEYIRMYDKIAKEVEPQLQQLEESLNSLKYSDNPRKQLGLVCVLSAYIKRQGNLVLLGEEASFLPAKELELCLRESLENLKLYGVATSISCKCEGILPKEHTQAAYSFFEAVIESSFPSLKALLVNLSVFDERIEMSILLACSERYISPNASFWDQMGAKTCISQQEDDVCVTFLLPCEGGAK